MDKSRVRSVFWPVLLVAVGVVWLLTNLNVLPPFNFRLLVGLWPLILIVGGLNLIIGRRADWLRMVVTALAVTGAIVYAYLAPALGLVRTPEILHAHFSEPVGVGEIVMDLSGLTLSEVIVNGGVGEVTVTMPALEGMYSVQIRGGVGRFALEIEDGADIQIDIDAGVGEFVIDLPDGARAELRANTGIGEIRLPSDFVEMNSSGRTVGISGTWVREGREGAAGQILIDYNGGVGSLRIR